MGVSSDFLIIGPPPPKTRAQAESVQPLGPALGLTRRHDPFFFFWSIFGRRTGFRWFFRDPLWPR